MLNHLVVVILVNMQLSSGLGTLELKLVSYDNPTSTVYDGTCCDRNKTSPCPKNQCDPWVDICIDHINSFASSCSAGLTKTPSHKNTDSFTFSPKEGKMVNPMNFTFHSWKGGFKLNITVQDDDHVDGNSPYGAADLMENLIYNLTKLSGSNGRPNFGRTNVTLGNIVHLVFEVMAYCNPNYYEDCSKRSFCKPVPGNYTCDNNGKPVFVTASSTWNPLTQTNKMPTQGKNTKFQATSISGLLVHSSVSSGTFSKFKPTQPLDATSLSKIFPSLVWSSTKQSSAASSWTTSSSAILSVMTSSSTTRKSAILSSVTGPSSDSTLSSVTGPSSDSILSSVTGPSSDSTLQAPTNGKTNTLTFVGVGIGALAFLVLLILLIVILYRKHSKKRRQVTIIRVNADRKIPAPLDQGRLMVEPW